VFALLQVKQVESQVRHLPSDKYFPATHPGTQVVSFNNHPSLHF